MNQTSYSPLVSADLDDCVAMIIVPCFNEARRLNVQAYLSYLSSEPNVTLLFVNDGSRDDTAAVLESMRRVCGRIEVLHLLGNRGKAEAVRQGMLRALAKSPTYIGYWDADLATPLETINDFIRIMRENSAIRLVLGARVKLLGRTIVRNELRHYAGRVFATAASLVLRLPIYDTQCGAKLFLADQQLATAIEAPFVARWVFDVELLARFQELAARDGAYRFEDVVYEYPLREWRDIAGSKVRPRDFVRAFFDLARIRLNFRERPEHISKAPAQPDRTTTPATQQHRELPGGSRG